jgi:hypothetical protein
MGEARLDEVAQEALDGMIKDGLPDDLREVIHVDPTRPNDTARACANLLRDDIYMRGPTAVMLVRSKDTIRARKAEDEGPGEGVVPGGVRHAGDNLQFSEAALETVVYRLDERARFLKRDGRSGLSVPVSCPVAVATRVVGAAGELCFRSCAGIAANPVFVAGRVIAEPGYNEELGIILDLDGSIPPIPEAPTKADALRAMETCLRPFRGYLGSRDEGTELRLRSALLAAVLTAVLRASLATAPALLIDANVPGAGKGKAARALGVIGTGRFPSIVTEGPDDKETEKRLASAILSGTPVIILDNVQNHLASSTLESALSEGSATIRLFGKLVDVTVPCSALVVITANNATMRPDMLRRSLPIRIVADTDRPEARRFSFEPYEEARRRRGEIVAAALAIARAWWRARDTEEGRRIRQATLGSFEEWAELVAGSTEWLTGLNPITLIEERKAEDSGRGSEQQVVEALRKLFGDKEWSAKDAIGQAGSFGEPGKPMREGTGIDPELWASVMPVKGDRPTPLQVGHWLRKRKDKVFTDLQLAGRVDRNGVARWAVRGMRGIAGDACTHAREVCVGDDACRARTEASPAIPRIPRTPPDDDSDFILPAAPAPSKRPLF